MDYISDIAYSIQARSGDVTILGPEVYTTIAEWEKKEIPLPIVMISIDQFCGENGTSAANSASMEALQAVVNQNFMTWLVNQQWAVSARA